MANIECLFADIQAAKFAAKVSLANDMRQALRLMFDDSVVHALLLAAKSEDIREDLFFRAFRLTRLSTDVRYRHPFDTALAAYLIILSLHDAAWSRILAEAVLQTPNCWLASRIARETLFEQATNKAAGIACSETRTAMSESTRAIDGHTVDSIGIADPRAVLGTSERLIASVTTASCSPVTLSYGPQYENAYELSCTDSDEFASFELRATDD